MELAGSSPSRPLYVEDSGDEVDLLDEGHTDEQPTEAAGPVEPAATWGSRLEIPIASPPRQTSQWPQPSVIHNQDTQPIISSLPQSSGTLDVDMTGLSRLEIRIASPRHRPSPLPPSPGNLDEDLETIITSDLVPQTQTSQTMQSSRDTPKVETSEPGSAAHSTIIPRPAEETVKRKRGRPRGQKNKTPPSTVTAARSDEKSLSRAARHKDKAPPNYAFKKRRPGRPPKKPSRSPEAIFETLCVAFIPFTCEWLGCPAELQNMATLRKHVRVVHGRAEACWWGQCAQKVPAVELFSDDEFERHMEEEHLIAYEWHMGDGYQNSLPDQEADPDDIPSYLLDKDGNQVTPSIKGQQFEDPATRRQIKQILKGLLAKQDSEDSLDSAD